jgi:hypothetical protein
VRAMNDDKEWWDAIIAITGLNLKDGERVYDPKPLAALLRSDKPILPAARHMLAEFIDPPEIPCSNLKLVPMPIVTARKDAEFILQHIPMIRQYHCLTEAGLSSSKAIKTCRDTLLAEGHNVSWTDESAFFKIRSKVLAFFERFNTTGKNSRKIGQ